MFTCICCGPLPLEGGIPGHINFQDQKARQKHGPTATKPELTLQEQVWVILQSPISSRTELPCLCAQGACNAESQESAGQHFLKSGPTHLVRQVHASSCIVHLRAWSSTKPTQSWACRCPDSGKRCHFKQTGLSEGMARPYHQHLPLHQGQNITENQTHYVLMQDTITREVERYQQSHIHQNTAYGELDHPSFESITFKELHMATISHQVSHRGPLHHAVLDSQS